MICLLESDAGRTVAYSGDGANAVLVFSTRERAQALANDMRVEPMKAVELTVPTVNAWIAKCKGHGVTEAIMDAGSLVIASKARRLKFAELVKRVYLAASPEADSPSSGLARFPAN